MEVSPMNKTAILSYIIDEVALKCRNVSTNMRKRIHWMLKYKEITLRKYDERTLVLNGWIKVGRGGVYISKVEEMKKGVSNYILKTEEHLDRVMTLNNEIRFYSLEFDPADPIEIEIIEYLVINQSNCDIISKYSINKAKYLKLKDLSTDQIKLILTRFKRIDKLVICSFSFESIDLSQFRINKFAFEYVSFKESVYLPKEISELELINCSPVNLLKVQKVNMLSYFGNRDDDIKELFESMKGVKAAVGDRSFAEYLTSLPSTVRRIYLTRSPEEYNNLQGIIKHFPCLIDIEVLFPIEALDETKLRGIYPKMIETEEKFKLRPRKILVTSVNAVELNNHPELFEEVECVRIDAIEFNFDLLPSKIKRIAMDGAFDEESVILNRLEKERGSIGESGILCCLL